VHWADVSGRVPEISAAKLSRYDNGGCEMLVAHMRGNGIRRPGGPTDVVLVWGPGDRMTAKVGVHPAPAGVVATNRSQHGLLTDAGANSMNPVAGVRS
jgi:hypothetical protein